jgi:protein ImuA
MLDRGRLDALRQTLAHLDAKTGRRQRPEVLALGVAALDAALDGGLAFGTLHDIAAAAPAQMGAATGFAAALAARTALATRATRTRPVLWIQQEIAGFEAGELYGPGFAIFGLPMGRLLVLRVVRARDVLWAMEEALASRALAGVIAELVKDDADLTATRRLSLAAAESGMLALLLNHHASPEASAAATRWRVAAHPGPRDAFDGLGLTAFALSLVKNRHGPTGLWHVAWDHHEHAFSAAPSGGVAAAAFDRPGRAPLARSA